ncbi:MAG: hypothetical protein FWJ66_05850 [Caldibacillus sp.]
MNVLFFLIALTVIHLVDFIIKERYVEIKAAYFSPYFHLESYN